MNVKHLTILLLSLILQHATAQTDDQEIPFSTNEGTLVGVGYYNIKNTYMSDVKYTGWGFHILNERMKKLRTFDQHLSAQQIFSADLSSTYNPAMTIGLLSRPSTKLKLLIGGSAHGLLGFMYNTQHSNNPFALTADAGLRFSVGAIYTFHVKNRMFSLRYQADMFLFGIAFAPNYDQSYYEIFGLNNYDGIINFTSIHNKSALRNYLTFDFPLENFTIRIGYLNNLYYTNIEKINTHHLSHNIMIGISKEFIAFGGKRLKNTHLYQSAFY